MVTIPLRGRVRQNGTLELHVQTGLPESEVDVVVIVQPSGFPELSKEEFIEETFGSFADSSLIRPAELRIDPREPLSFHHSDRFRSTTTQRQYTGGFAMTRKNAASP